MVLYVQKYDIVPGKTDEFIEWAKAAIPQILSAPGIVELRSYRPAVSDCQIATTYEFADMASWAEWQASATMQQLLTEVRTFTTNFRTELWGPSPVVPAPLRPGQ
jgi:antibiotic biosynthesis monooxygenase (ABM) superfamily enzyme